MAQSNHNASYLLVVDGLTIWERLRVIRNFLQDRKIALKLTNLNQRKNEAKIKSGELDEFKIEELEIYKEQTEQNIKHAKDEISFLEKLEAELAIRAEETRIKGKTDDEMYEINYFEELVQLQLLQVKSEIMSVGHITPDTMKTLIRNKETMLRVVELGYLNSDALNLTGSSSDISAIGYNHAIDI